MQMKIIQFLRSLTFIGLITSSSALVCMERETIYDVILNQFVKDTTPAPSWWPASIFATPAQPDLNPYSTELLKVYLDFIMLDVSNSSPFKDLVPALFDTISTRPEQTPKTPFQPIIGNQPGTIKSAPTIRVITPKTLYSWRNIPGAIYFYDKNDPFFEFTNFYQKPITIDGRTWPTTEHYYQAMKFMDRAIQETIRKMPTSGDAFKYAQANAHLVRRDWQSVSLNIMVTAVAAKFMQNQGLKNTLLNTKRAILVEDAQGKDAFYGAGADYKGQNHLGRILMHLRKHINSITNTNPLPPYYPATTFSLGSKELQELLNKPQ